MIVGRTMWTQCTSVTDRRTDRRTDRITMTKTVQRIASHGNEVIKSRLIQMPEYLDMTVTIQEKIVTQCQNMQYETRNTLDCDQTNYFSRIFSHCLTSYEFGQTGNSAIRSDRHLTSHALAIPALA